VAGPDAAEPPGRETAGREAVLPADPRSIWLSIEPPDDPPRQAKHRLVQEIQRLIEVTALLETAECPPEELDALTASVAEVARRAEALPSMRDKGGMTASLGHDASLLERSGISGRSNPIAAPMRMTAIGPRTYGWAVYGAVYEGPPGCLHGGFIAAAFDDLLGMAQVASGQAGYTGTLTVRMRRPTPLYQRIDYEAWVERAEGRKIWAKATSKAGDVLLADAEILFIAPKWNLIESRGGGLAEGGPAAGAEPVA
jgi:hypothetical protein